MNETNFPEPVVKPAEKRSHTVAIITIIATAVVLLACIGACAVTLNTYILNTVP